MILFFLSITSLWAAKPFFQAELFWDKPHQINWVYSEPQKEWKQTPSIKLKCDTTHTLKVGWLNSKTLMAEVTPPLNPGEKCQVELQSETYSFHAPKIKILDIGPYRFEYEFDEEDPIAVRTDHPIDQNLFLKTAYLEVEGIEEKIQFDILDVETTKKVHAQEYGEDGKNIFWFKIRRRLPSDKKITLVIPEGQTYAFHKTGKVRPGFSVEVSCQRSNINAPCSPLGKISLQFTSSVEKKYWEKIKLKIGKDSFAPEIKNAEETTSYYFPQTLQSETEVSVDIPKDLKDNSGRALLNSSRFPLTLKVGEFPPLIKLPGAFGIVDHIKEPVLPITIRNTENPLLIRMNKAHFKKMTGGEILKWLKLINERQYQGYEKDLRSTSIFEKNTPLKEYKLQSKLSKKDLETIGLPLENRGLHLIEAESPKVGASLLANGEVFYISSMALVTDLGLHLKMGEKNALVWVTSLQSGRSVAGAQVKLFQCDGKLVHEGISGKDGIVFFKSLAPTIDKCETKNGERIKLVATAQTQDDFSFTLSSWTKGIEPWRYSLSYHYSQPLSYHTVFDRPIYRQNETVSFMVLVREATEGHIKLPLKSLHQTIRISHSSGKSWNEKIIWNDLKGGVGSFKLSEESPLGHYSLDFITKTPGSTWEQTENVGSFLVESFSVPLMRMSLQWKDRKNHLYKDDTGELLGSLAFLAGGSASEIPLTARTTVNRGYFQGFKEYPDYYFIYGYPDIREKTDALELEIQKTQSDKKGDFKFSFENIKTPSHFSSLSSEVEYMDPSGRIQTGHVSASIFPSKYLIGIKSISSIKKNAKNKIEMMVVSSEGKPIKNAWVEAILFERVYHSTRKKILGGFYSYEGREVFNKKGSICEGKTNKEGMLNCSLTVSESGSYYISAKTKDDDGRVSNTYISSYTEGDENHWDDYESMDRADLITSKKEYFIGEKVEFTFKVPFQQSQILITTEDSDIQSYMIRDFKGEEPRFNLAIEDKHRPNMYISAFAVRGRIDTPTSHGMIDLGKPAFRMGLTELKVNRKNAILKLHTKVEKPVVKPRDEQIITFKVDRPKSLSKLKIAVAVIDAGLLELAPQDSFDLRSSFISFKKHDVDTATAHTFIIGKRHFGLKAKPHGGSGGKLTNRELFDTLLYWNPNVTITPAGDAKVRFKLNDSLTKFKVFALAYSESEFDSTEESFISTQDLLVFSGLSTSLRETDQTKARYQLKNTTSKEIKAEVEYKNSSSKLLNKKVILKSEASEWIDFPVVAPKGQPSLEHQLTVKVNGKVVDKLITKQTIKKLRNFKVALADVFSVSPKVAIPVRDDISAVKLNFSESILGSLTTISDYLKDYPYQCLEQRWSKVLVLENKDISQKFLKDLPLHQDDSGLFKLYPSSSMKPSVSLTNHILETAFWKKYKFPPGIQEKAIKGLTSWVEGKIPMGDYEKSYFKQLKHRTLATLALLVPNQKIQTASADAPAETDSLSLLLDKWIIFTTSQNGEQVSRTLDLVRKRLDIKSAKFTLKFRPEDDQIDFYQSQIQVTARLILLLENVKVDSEFRTFYQGEKNKFLRMLTEHKKYGHYGETLSNAWASLVMQNIKSTKVTGKTIVDTHQLDWVKTNPSLTLANPKKEIHVSHEGQGQPVVDASYLVMPTGKERITKDFKLSLDSSSDKLKVGQRYDYTLEIKNEIEASQIGLRIPLPASTSIISREIEKAEILFEERDHDEFRVYFDSLPKGTTVLKMKLRFDQPGAYQVPGAQIEEMYSPEHQALEPEKVWNVQ
jgi:alpha-2-macroglobulin